MIDIHSHIIPKVDDGSKSVEETFNMIMEAKNVGFTNIFLTSHYLTHYYETDTAELIFWKEKLQEAIDYKKIKVKLHSGMEVYITDRIKELLEQKKLLTLNNSRYFLLELPLSTTINYLEHVLDFLNSVSIKPILAHPERYRFVQEKPSLVQEYINNGMLIQCNYGSILGIYGNSAKNTMKTLLKKDMVHFLGSDCHREGTIYTLIPEAIKKIKKIVGEQKFEEISTLNPQKILNNEDWNLE